MSTNLTLEVPIEENHRGFGKQAESMRDLLEELRRSNEDAASSSDGPLTPSKKAYPLGPANKQIRNRRSLACILREKEVSLVWRRMHADDGETMPITWKQCQDMMNEMSKWRVDPDKYELVDAPGIFTDRPHGVVEGIWRSPTEDEVAAASNEQGVAARKLAAGERVHMTHLQKVPEIRAIATEYKLLELTEWIRDNLPARKDANGYDLRREEWSQGHTMKLLDRWMLYSGRYKYKELERMRGSCTYAKIAQAASEVSGIQTRSIARRLAFTQSHDEGVEARKIWQVMFENRSICVITDGKPAVLRIMNPDGSVRMMLRMHRLCYNEQICTSRGRNAKSHTHPSTIRGFTIAFFRSLFGEGKFTDTGLGNQVTSCLHNLRTAPNSCLFHGYAWELEVNGKVYFKS